MATMLAFEDEAVPSAPRNDHVPVSAGWTGPLPERYVVREIEFKVVGGRLQFAYRDERRARPLPVGGPLELASFFCAAPSPAVRAVQPIRAPAGEGPQTPLDLDVTGAPLLILLKLAEPSNMLFSATVGAVTHKSSDDMGCYGRLRHVTAEGIESIAPVAGCRLVSFIAMPPTGDYRHGFNFNIDLEQDPGPGEDQSRLLPIMIDPDVRHPGGSST
jgi:hypothetical protein